MSLDDTVTIGVLEYPDTMFQHPLTVTQHREIEQDIQHLQDMADQLSSLLTGAYGDQDQRAVRASELAASAQRLRWAMERANLPSDAASA